MNPILIVDDDEPFREMLHAVLEIRGFNVLVAATPAEGLELAASHELDAVFSDYQMPKADGLSFCRALRQLNARLNRCVPVWLMTGTVTLSEKDAQVAGAEGIFRKPFHVAEITKTLERLGSTRRVTPAAADIRTRETIAAH